MAAEFQRLQRQFAGHLRDPDRNAAPAGLDERRVRVHRELVLDNLSGLLAGTFPVLRSLHDEDAWTRLVRGWLRGHRLDTPLFPELGGEFVRWLETRDCPLPEACAELAHYEWMEVVAANAQADLESQPHDPDGDLLHARPVVSPLVWPLRYRHAVHRIAPGQPPRRQATCLVVVRGRDERIGFLEANPLTLELIERLRANASENGLAVLSALAAGTGLDPQAAIRAGTILLQRLRERDIVLGSDRGEAGAGARADGREPAPERPARP